MNWEVWTMKSRTLSCEWTILRKDLTRFAPMWISLGVVLAMCAFDQLNGSYPDPYEFLPLGFVFAPIFAVNLFGYLTDSAECSAVHSLPLRREKLFLIHTAAAFLMYLVSMSIYFIAVSSVLKCSYLSWLGWSALDFAFSFAVALLCVFITGRKIGAALLYIFFQTLPTMVGLYIEYLFLPLLPGVAVDIDVLYPGLTGADLANFIGAVFHDRVEGPVWLDAVIILAVTLVIFGICLLMYRKRRLEHAGDLLAVRWLDPVFAVCSGLTGACVIDMFFGLGGTSFDPFLFGLGLTFGYFSYWMLSKKSARVFKPRILAGFAALAVAVAGSVLVISRDPLDRVYYQPDVSMVKSASISRGAYDPDAYVTEDPEQIRQLQDLQLELVHWAVIHTDVEYGNTVNVIYELENGKRIRRQYELKDAALEKQVSWYLSQPYTFFKTDAPLVGSIEVTRDEEVLYIPREQVQELTEVFLEDCRQGRMFSFSWDPTDPEWVLEFRIRDGSDVRVTLKASAVETIDWLNANCSPE